MEDSLPFSSDEWFDYQSLLDEAIEIILSAEAQLGPGDETKNISLEELVIPLRNLKEAQIFFASAPTVQSLNLEDFARRNLTPAPLLQKWMLTHNLYLIQVPVTLKPAFGWSFSRLECGVVFQNVGKGMQPKIHDIYPDDVWSELFHLQTHVILGLNTELAFRADLEPVEAAIQSLSTESRARLSANVNGEVQLVVGPFSTSIYRSQVLGRGRENSKAFWQLDGSIRVQREEPYLAMVLRLSKDVHEIEAQARMVAYNKFDFSPLNLADWPGRFREKLRSFFSNGLPLEATVIWKDILAQ